MVPTSVTGLPLRHICVAIGVGVILSLFILALTAPQTMTTQYSPKITSVSTPEPVYVDAAVSEPELIPEDDDGNNNPFRSFADAYIGGMILCCAILSIIAVTNLFIESDFLESICGVGLIALVCLLCGSLVVLPLAIICG